LQKPCHRDSDGTYLNSRAVIANAININTIVNSLTTFLYNATANLAHLLLRDTKPNAYAKAKEPKAIAPSIE
jgi:hypothetical protein